MKITRFTLTPQKKHLLIAFAKNQVFALSYEYLRVFSPHTLSHKPAPLEVHKKQVELQHIEAVGKHGYRFIFDDKHQAIYSIDYLNTLAVEQESRWQQYLTQLKASGHSREAMIDITQL